MVANYTTSLKSMKENLSGGFKVAGSVSEIKNLLKYFKLNVEQAAIINSVDSMEFYRVLFASNRVYLRYKEEIDVCISSTTDLSLKHCVTCRSEDVEYVARNILKNFSFEVE